MQRLNLPEYQFRIKKDRNKFAIFDEIRKKFLVLTPEEWVRQNFIKFLNQEKKFPMSLIGVERMVMINQNPLRCDLLVYNRKGLPFLVVECKAPNVRISQDTFDQIARYNMQLKVPYLVVTNGLQHYCCLINYEQQSYEYLQNIPVFPE